QALDDLARQTGHVTVGKIGRNVSPLCTPGTLQVGLLATKIALEAGSSLQTPALEPGLLRIDRQIEVALRNEPFERHIGSFQRVPGRNPGAAAGDRHPCAAQSRAIPGKPNRPGFKSRPLCVVYEAS